MEKKKDVYKESHKLFKVYCKDNKPLGHISALNEQEGLAEAKLRNKAAHHCLAFSAAAPKAAVQAPVKEEDAEQPKDEKTKDDKAKG